MVRRWQTHSDAALHQISQQLVASWKAKPCFCWWRLGRGEPPRAPPQHPGPGRQEFTSWHLICCLRPALPRYRSEAPRSLRAQEVAEKRRPVIFQTFSKLFHKIFFFLFFCLPRCSFAFPAPEPLFSSLPFAQTRLQRFARILLRVTQGVFALLAWV